MTIVREDNPAEGVALLRLSRPDVLNALNLEMRRRLADELDSISGEPGIRATVLTGDRRAFAAGADIALLADKGTAAMHELGLPKLWARIFAHPKPLLAAVNGYAFGGGFELALLCDILVAGPGSRFALPEVKLGIMPGAGGTQRLVRLVGRHRAMGLLLRGEPIDGRTAHQWGLLTEFAEDDDGVLPMTIELARVIATMPPLAVEMIKSAVIEGADLPLGAALMLEQRNMQVLFDTDDQKQRMAAFLEKRRARG